MGGDAKERMVESAVALLASRGLQAASFSEVLEHSGAPRGSVYHHFPGGKGELVAAALALASARALTYLEARAGSAEAVCAAFLQLWREVLGRSRLEAGCSVLAVAVAADTPELRDAAGAIFRSWREHLSALLHAGGLKRRDAGAFAALLIASCEGAVAMARAERSLEPFEEVAAALSAQLASLPRRSGW
jgi:TetR/AcrR family transcriptional regulator, lmrAB and yxaGH operons repressor